MGWRPLLPGDLPRLVAIAGQVHAAYPERAEVFAERLALDPAGCFAFDVDGAMAGYALSHPWAGAPPKLDTLLGGLPARAEWRYLHDVALAPAARGRGATAALLPRVEAAARARDLSRLALVAIDGLAPFWARLGFAAAPAPPGAALDSYDPGAVFMLRTVGAGSCNCERSR